MPVKKKSTKESRAVLDKRIKAEWKAHFGEVTLKAYKKMTPAQRKTLSKMTSKRKPFKRTKKKTK